MRKICPALSLYPLFAPHPSRPLFSLWPLNFFRSLSVTFVINFAAFSSARWPFFYAAGRPSRSPRIFPCSRKASRTIELTCIGASASVVPTSEHHSPSFATRCWSRLGLTQDQFLVVPTVKKSIFLKMCSRLILLIFCVDSKSG